MEVRMANKAGFCYGVKRAIEMALKTSGEKGGSIFTLGPIIHNPQVVKDLADKGINELDCLDDIADGTIIIRSHGVGPEILEQIKQKGLELIDATCPFVARAQRYAKEMADKNLIVFILGDPGHPEVQGILGWSRDKGIVVEKAQEISRVEHSKVGW
ncbi:hypothetical protein N752_22385 [Desulforamulus aquiferis]|nr:hypothetical protein [Desulforamulus aquiferis]RYD02937.1 hypothetical protein N752_22385 [Desulforamulus aquiferis]